jgi:hypothetical protein
MELCSIFQACEEFFSVVSLSVLYVNEYDFNCIYVWASARQYLQRG